MSEDQKQFVEQSLSEATGAQISIEQAEALNEKLYHNLYKNLYKEMSESTVTKKNVLRGIFKALDVGVDSGNAPTLQNETEAKIAGFFAQLLDKRLIILAKNFQAEEVARLEAEAEEKNKQENQGEQNGEEKEQA